MSSLPLPPGSFELPTPALKTPAPTTPRRRLRPTFGRTLLWLVPALLVVGWGLFHLWHSRLSTVTVQTAPVSTNVPLQVFGLGTVGARVESNVGFKVTGVLVSLNADEGDRVAAGSILARLDDRDVRAQLESARANVAQANANIGKAEADIASAAANLANDARISNRRTLLAGHGFASAEEAQTAQAATRIAQANLAVAQNEAAVARAALLTAKAQQDYAQVAVENDTLIAPYDALVVSRNLQPGSMPVPGQSVFTLVDPKTIWVVAYVDERLAGRIAVGQPARIVLRSNPTGPLPGHVARIEVQSDAVNEERVVEVAFDDMPAHIHLAEQAEVFITTAMLPRAVLVPPAAASDRDGSIGTVWTLESGKLNRRRVSFGKQRLDGQLPIIGGLPDGAKVVVSPASHFSVARPARAEKDVRRPARTARDSVQ